MPAFEHVGGESARHGKTSATVASGGIVSSAVEVRGYRRGAFYLPAEFNGDTVTFQGAETTDGTFALIHNADGTALSITADASNPKWYQMNDALLAMGAIKIVTGTATDAAATILISLKT